MTARARREAHQFATPATMERLLYDVSSITKTSRRLRRLVPLAYEHAYTSGAGDGIHVRHERPDPTAEVFSDVRKAALRGGLATAARHLAEAQQLVAAAESAIHENFGGRPGWSMKPQGMVGQQGEANTTLEDVKAARDARTRRTGRDEL